MRLARDIVTYGLGDAAVRAAALITVPIYTRLFPPEEYGVLAYALALSGIALVILGLGGESAFSRYWFDLPEAARRTLTSTWICFVAAWSATAVLPLVFWRNELAATLLDGSTHGVALALAFVAVPFTLVGLTCGQVLRNRFQPITFVALNLLMVTLTVGIGLTAVLVFDAGVVGVLLGMALAPAMLLPFRLWTVRDVVGLTFSAPLLRQMLGFGMPLMVASGAYWVLTTSDRILLEQFIGVGPVGIYSVAVTLSMLVHLALGAIGQAWSPHFLAIYRAEPDRAPRVAADFALLIVAGFGWISVLLATYAEEFVRLLSGGGYQAAAVAVLPLALSVSANAAAQVTAVGISIRKRTHWMAWLSWAAAGLNVGLNVLLIPRWGIAGAAWATAFAFAALSLSYGVVSQRLWPMPFQIGRVGLLVGLTVGAGFVGSQLSLGGLWPTVALKAGFLAAVALALASVCGITLLRNLRGLLDRPAQPMATA
jgi:O-antigen/teichoic acid export membrane protein